jgi:hypothetical protein
MSNQISSESTFKKLSKTNNNMDDESTFKNISLSQSPVVTSTFSESNGWNESDGWNEKKDKEAREAYNMARDCGSYDYYKFIRYFPEEEEEEEEELVKCPTCEEMIYSDEQLGMCYDCFKNEQKLYPDDIPMELRYRN